MTVVDSSVAVAAFAVWHAQHDAADEVLGKGAWLPAHCALEMFSVLTRIPPPRRVPGHLVRDFLADRFRDPYISLDAEGYRALIPRLVELGIDGGAVYDALVAATTIGAGERLVSCDRRAAQTYERLGVDFRLLP